MKYALLPVMLLAICPHTWAGELNKANIAVKLYLSEGCGTDHCSVDVNAKIRYRFEASLDVPETTSFGEDTVLSLNAPLLPASLDLKTVPGFSPGQTSLTYTTTTLEYGLPLKQSWAVDWTGGNLKIDYSLSIKGQASGDHPPVSELLGIMGTKLKIASEKGHTLPGLQFSLRAANSGSTFLNLPGLLICNATVLEGGTLDKKGVLSEVQIREVKGNKFIPLIL